MSLVLEMAIPEGATEPCGSVVLSKEVGQGQEQVGGEQGKSVILLLLCN